MAAENPSYLPPTVSASGRRHAWNAGAIANRGPLDEWGSTTLPEVRAHCRGRAD
ncbi:MAG: hypothetical protein ACPIOQ_67755 [Promethearchaeia archaeon]